MLLISLMLLSFLNTSLGENFKFIKLVTSLERYCLQEFNDFEVGDFIEAFSIEEIAQSL